MSVLVQRTDEWLALRKTKITATDACVIMGVNPWKTSYRLLEEKLGYVETGPINERMQRGIDLEPVALDLFNIKTGLEMEPCVVFHPDHDWMMASLDGITKYGPNVLGDNIVEIKCAGKVDHGAALKGKVPKKYYPQLQHQLAVTGLDMAHYFSFDGIDGVILEVKRDDEYIEKMIEAEKRFYDILVESKERDLWNGYKL